MALTVYPPCEALRPYIRSFSIEETTGTALRKVLPGTAAVMGFQFRGNLFLVTRPPHPLIMANSPQLNFTPHTPPPTRAESPESPLAPAGITGLQDSYRLFRNSAGTGTLLVHFTETGAANFFESPLHLLYNASNSLQDLVPASEISRIEEQLAATPDNNTRITLIEQWLLSRRRNSKPDALIQTAVAKIHHSKGQLRIASLSQELYISPSRLEKRFRAAVGASPKKFANLVRLQQVLKATPTNGDLTALAYEAGYFDQSHFIHDFTAHTGVTPADFFRNTLSHP